MTLLGILPMMTFAKEGKIKYGYFIYKGNVENKQPSGKGDLYFKDDEAPFISGDFQKDTIRKASFPYNDEHILGTITFIPNPLDTKKMRFFMDGCVFLHDTLIYIDTLSFELNKRTISFGSSPNGRYSFTKLKNDSLVEYYSKSSLSDMKEQPRLDSILGKFHGKAYQLFYHNDKIVRFKSDLFDGIFLSKKNSQGWENIEAIENGTMTQGEVITNTHGSFEGQIFFSKDTIKYIDGIEKINGKTFVWKDGINKTLKDQQEREREKAEKEKLERMWAEAIKTNNYTAVLKNGNRLNYYDFIKHCTLLGGLIQENSINKYRFRTIVTEDILRYAKKEKLDKLGLYQYNNSEEIKADWQRLKKEKEATFALRIDGTCNWDLDGITKEGHGNYYEHSSNFYISSLDGYKIYIPIKANLKGERQGTYYPQKFICKEKLNEIILAKEKSKGCDLGIVVLFKATAPSVSDNGYVVTPEKVFLFCVKTGEVLLDLTPSFRKPSIPADNERLLYIERMEKEEKENKKRVEMEYRRTCSCCNGKGWLRNDNGDQCVCCDGKGWVYEE